MNHDHADNSSDPPAFWRSRYAVGLLVMGAVAAYFLLSEHRAHFIYSLPYLLLLACLSMHVFMHHGHGQSSDAHADHSGADDRLSAPKPPPTSKRSEQS